MQMQVEGRGRAVESLGTFTCTSTCFTEGMYKYSQRDGTGEDAGAEVDMWM
jgi:hypothetical protein